jgi:hypothetical protein
MEIAEFLIQSFFAFTSSHSHPTSSQWQSNLQKVKEIRLSAFLNEVLNPVLARKNVASLSGFPILLYALRGMRVHLYVYHMYKMAMYAGTYIQYWICLNQSTFHIYLPSTKNDSRLELSQEV